MPPRDTVPGDSPYRKWLKAFLEKDFGKIRDPDSEQVANQEPTKGEVAHPKVSFRDALPPPQKVTSVGESQPLPVKPAKSMPQAEAHEVVVVAQPTKVITTPTATSTPSQFPLRLRHVMAIAMVLPVLLWPVFH